MKYYTSFEVPDGFVPALRLGMEHEGSRVKWANGTQAGLEDGRIVNQPHNRFETVFNVFGYAGTKQIFTEPVTVAVGQSK